MSKHVFAATEQYAIIRTVFQKYELWDLVKERIHESQYLTKGEVYMAELPDEDEVIDVRLNRQERVDDGGTGSPLRSLQPWEGGLAARTLSQLDGPFSWGSDA